MKQKNLTKHKSCVTDSSGTPCRITIRWTEVPGSRGFGVVNLLPALGYRCRYVAKQLERNWASTDWNELSKIIIQKLAWHSTSQFNVWSFCHWWRSRLRPCPICHLHFDGGFILPKLSLFQFLRSNMPFDCFLRIASENLYFRSSE